MLFPFLYIFARIWRRKGPVRAEDMDFISGIAEIEASTYDEPPPRNKWEKFWQWLVSCLDPGRGGMTTYQLFSSRCKVGFANICTALSVFITTASLIAVWLYSRYTSQDVISCISHNLKLDFYLYRVLPFAGWTEARKAEEG